MEHVKDKRIVRRMLRKINLKVWAKTGADIGWEALGSLLLAVTTYNVALSAEFPMTGFSGIAMILYRLFQIPMGLSTILLNIPVAVICGKLIGKRFLVKSFRCMILSSLMLDYLAPLFPVYEGDRMVAALITGTVGAMGYAMIYVRGSSTGGSDFINLAIKAVRPHWNLGTIAFLSDVGIILTGGILFRDMDGIVYGMVINLLFAVVVDKVILGMNAGMVALIVTEHGKEVAREIDRCIDCYGTGEDGYRGGGPVLYAGVYSFEGRRRVLSWAKGGGHGGWQQQGHLSDTKKDSGDRAGSIYYCYGVL